MREYKRSIKHFALYDKTGICKYLEKQAAEGWMLIGIVSGFMWEFKRIEPQQLKFSVVYFGKASEYDHEPTEGQQSFREYCEHSGWSFAASNAQTFVFYTADENAVPIETDALVEVENIHYVMKRKYILPYITIVLLQGFNLFMHLRELFDEPISSLISNTYISLIVTLVTIVLFFLYEVVGYFNWYFKAVRVAKTYGGFVDTKSYSKEFLSIAFIIIIFALLNMAFSADNKVLYSIAGAAAVAIAILVIIRGSIRLMKMMKVSAKINRILSIIISVGLSLAIIMFVTPAIIKNTPDNVADNQDFSGYVEADEFSRTMPIELGDFQAEAEPYFSSIKEEKSLALKQTNAWQRAKGMELEYVVLDIRLPFVYNLCLNNIFDKYFVLGNFYDAPWDNISYKEVPATPWGANKAYELCAYGEHVNRYLLCYDNMIVEFIPSWELTDEQVKTAAEKFVK